MENWTLDKWLSELDDHAKQDLYFEISGHSAGALRDRINHLKDIKDKEIERLRDWIGHINYHVNRNGAEHSSPTERYLQTVCLTALRGDK